MSMVDAENPINAVRAGSVVLVKRAASDSPVIQFNTGQFAGLIVTVVLGSSILSALLTVLLFRFLQRRRNSFPLGDTADTGDRPQTSVASITRSARSIVSRLTGSSRPSPPRLNLLRASIPSPTLSDSVAVYCSPALTPKAPHHSKTIREIPPSPVSPPESLFGAAGNEPVFSRPLTPPERFNPPLPPPNTYGGGSRGGWSGGHARSRSLPLSRFFMSHSSGQQEREQQPFARGPIGKDTAGFGGLGLFSPTTTATGGLSPVGESSMPREASPIRLALKRKESGDGRRRVQLVRLGSRQGDAPAVKASGPPGGAYQEPRKGPERVERVEKALPPPPPASSGRPSSEIMAEVDGSRQEWMPSTAEAMSAATIPIQGPMLHAQRGRSEGNGRSTFFISTEGSSVSSPSPAPPAPRTANASLHSRNRSGGGSRDLTISIPNDPIPSQKTPAEMSTSSSRRRSRNDTLRQSIQTSTEPRSPISSVPPSPRSPFYALSPPPPPPPLPQVPPRHLLPTNTRRRSPPRPTPRTVPRSTPTVTTPPPPAAPPVAPSPLSQKRSSGSASSHGAPFDPSPMSQISASSYFSLPPAPGAPTHASSSTLPRPQPLGDSTLAANPPILSAVPQPPAPSHRPPPLPLTRANESMEPPPLFSGTFAASSSPSTPTGEHQNQHARTPTRPQTLSLFPRVPVTPMIRETPGTPSSGVRERSQSGGGRLQSGSTRGGLGGSIGPPPPFSPPPLPSDAHPSPLQSNPLTEYEPPTWGQGREEEPKGSAEYFRRR